jgi:hypothetical protein
MKIGGQGMKKIVLVVLSFIVISLFVTYTYEKNKQTYSAPTKEQVTQFISENAINPLLIKETTACSIILFENQTEYGHYVLYQDQNHKLYHAEVVASGDSNENQVLLGGVASGKVPFITAIINDEELLKKAKEIEVTFADQTVVNEKITNKANIILYKNEKNIKPMHYIKIVIYDKDRNALYEA